MRIAAGEIAARGTGIRHEEGVADEDRVTDVVSHIRRRMTGDVQGLRLQLADMENLVCIEQVIELRTIEFE
ncbi:hypothetical protein D3C81_2222060 [compost metagenome]